MIDVVYTELFNELAEGFVKRLNLRTEQVRAAMSWRSGLAPAAAVSERNTRLCPQKYKKALVQVSFPFHWGSFFFYFLALAAFVPFSRPIITAVTGGEEQPAAAANQDEAGQGWLREADYGKFWYYEKRTTLELDAALIGESCHHHHHHYCTRPLCSGG